MYVANGAKLTVEGDPVHDPEGALLQLSLANPRWSGFDQGDAEDVEAGMVCDASRAFTSERDLQTDVQSRLHMRDSPLTERICILFTPRIWPMTRPDGVARI